MGKNIEVKLNKKQDQLTAGKGIRIENNVISAVYEDVDQVVFATKSQFPYIGEEDRLYVAKNEKNIYIWDAQRQDYILLNSEVIPEIDVIDGGDADSD